MKETMKGRNKDTDLFSDNDKKAVRNKEFRRKLVRIILKILRWPVMLIGIPALSFFLPYLLSGEENLLAATANDTVFLIMVIGLLVGTIASGIIGALIKKSFLATTGIAALVYIVASFFIKKSSFTEGFNPYESTVSFENTKLIFVVLLIVLIFIGDLIVLTGRLIKDRMESKE